MSKKTLNVGTNNHGTVTFTYDPEASDWPNLHDVGIPFQRVAVFKPVCFRMDSSFSGYANEADLVERVGTAAANTVRAEFDWWEKAYKGKKLLCFAHWDNNALYVYAEEKQARKKR